MSKIFVYGSLRRKGRLNQVLINSEFLGMHRTNNEYTMYSLGAFPALVKVGKSSVLGELYDVSLNTLAELDRIEGHPHFYKRTPIIIDGIEAEVYLLMENPGGCEVVESGDWIKYSLGLE